MRMCKLGIASRWGLLLVLNRLSQLHYERAEDDDGAGEVNRERYEKGKDYGLRSLALLEPTRAAPGARAARFVGGLLRRAALDTKADARYNGATGHCSLAS